MKKKRIGIITLPPMRNYGCILQAYALQTVLARMGFDAELIAKRLYPRQLTYVEKLFVYPFRLIKKKIFHKKCQIRREKIKFDEVYQTWILSSKYTLQFASRNIRHNYVYDYKEVKEHDYYAIIVGSDQIWRPIYVGGVNMRIENAYLDFTKDWKQIKRISYAASFGSRQWEYDEESTKACKALLSKFNAVSCRERSGEDFCKLYLGFPQATTVLDPTMLLDSKDYLALCEGYPVENKSGIMCYVLDKNDRSERVVSFVQHKLGCGTFEVRAKSFSENAPEEDRIQPPVEEWIKGFQNASFVITDSFHACVFSILFQKPFAVLVNYDRGAARYDSLLGPFGLSYRMIDDFDEERIERILSEPLKVEQSVLDEKRGYALSFLKRSLGVDD